MIAAVLRKSALDAAFVGVADAIELRRIGDRQRAQQDAMNQREDGGVGADAEGQRDAPAVSVKPGDLRNWRIA